MIQVMLWLPLAAGLLACLVPRRYTGWVAATGAFVALDLAIRILADFDPSGGLQHTVNESWIPDLGVRYQLGIDGISVFLVLLTAALWFAATTWSRDPDAGPAEDLVPDVRAGRDGHPRRLPRPGPGPVRPLLRPDADPVLLPVRELGRALGRGGKTGSMPPRATIKMMVYTLVGSLLMLVGAIATGDPRGRRRRASPTRCSALAADPLGQRLPGLDLLVLRGRLPGEDAGLPAARLDARRLPGGAAAGAGRVLGGALQGRRLRLPADRAADLPRRHHRASRRW